MSQFFKSEQEYHLLNCSLPLAVLNRGMKEEGVTTSITASKRGGLIIRFCGQIVAKGMTPAELQASFKAATEKAAATLSQR